MPDTDDSSFLVALTTAPSLEAADAMAQKLVKNRLAACVNQVPGVRSTYVWNGEVQSETEVQLIIKTRAQLWPSLLAFVQEHHPYDNPELVALRPAEVAPAYAAWIQENTKAQ